MPPFLDIAVTPVLAEDGPRGLVLGFLFIPVLEAWLLFRFFRWPGFRRALLDATVANLCTGIVGVLLYLAWPYRPRAGSILAMYLLTVVLEALFLQFWRRQGWALTWKASIVVNAVSYSGLLLLARSMDLLP